MFFYIKGILEEVAANSVVIENNGIGYEICIPAKQVEALPPKGREVKLFTYLQVKEDALALFGFSDKETLDMFKQLLLVSGVGPKAAIAILSMLSANELKVAILSQDSKAISKAQGVGAKTAQRIIIDLKDKVNIDDVILKDDFDVTEEQNVSSAAKQETVLALTALGYSSKEAKNAVSQVDDNEEYTVEDYLKLALKFMG